MNIMKKIARRKTFGHGISTRHVVKLLDPKTLKYKLVTCNDGKEAGQIVKEHRRSWVFAPTRPLSPCAAV